ncbi:MAG: hypothetical protein GX237_05330 [Clostridiales bacterium]|nr:hypothetical protein [Clostridiales bacterium]
MDLLEIIMLLIGIAVIIISSIIVKNKSSEGDISKEKEQDKLLKISQEYKEKLTATSDELMADTEEYLSRLSNEKIMAVSEFSDQVLEKINYNHEEVVFLYNMLNNKEKELKELVKEFGNTEQKTKDYIEDNKYESGPDKPKRINVQAQAMNGSSSSVDEEASQSTTINNAEILKLHSEGQSIMEISKQLGIGQGEIKLIIELYKGK